jgi:hypothetical protein
MNISHHLEEQGRALPDPNPAVTILLSQATHDAAGIQGAEIWAQNKSGASRRL